MASDQRIVSAVLVGGAALLLWSWWTRGEYRGEQSIVSDLEADVLGSLNRSNVRDLRASEQVRAILRKSENYRAEPYTLNDGGWTIGFGHFERNRADLPDFISYADALELFERDVYERAEKWVKAYVTVDLAQHEYDALVHVAFNMSPRSFRKVAAVVNAGGDFRAAIMEFVRPDLPHLTAGLIARREREALLFNQGVYS